MISFLAFFLLFLFAVLAFLFFRRRRFAGVGMTSREAERGRIYRLFRDSVLKEQPRKSAQDYFRVILRKYGAHWRDYREFIPRVLDEAEVPVPANVEEQIHRLQLEMDQGDRGCDAPRPIHLTVDDIDNFTPTQFRGLVEKTLSKMGYRCLEAGNSVTLLMERNQERVVVCVALGKDPVGVESLDSTLALLGRHNCTGAFLIANREFTPECRREAKEVTVELIDRRGLQAWLDEYVNEVSDP